MFLGVITECLYFITNKLTQTSQELKLGSILFSFCTLRYKREEGGEERERGEGWGREGVCVREGEGGEGGRGERGRERTEWGEGEGDRGGTVVSSSSRGKRRRVHRRGGEGGRRKRKEGEKSVEEMGMRWTVFNLGSNAFRDAFFSLPLLDHHPLLFEREKRNEEVPCLPCCGEEGGQQVPLHSSSFPSWRRMHTIGEENVVNSAGRKITHCWARWDYLD